MAKTEVDAGRKRSGAAGWAAALLLVFAVIGFTQWRSGAWQAGYGAYPDEPSHFMGGLMVRDFLVSGSHSPVQFAQNYYLFQPYFAIGHWPPFFYVLEGLWMLVAGTSRLSVMVLIAMVSGALALLLFATVRRWLPPGLSLALCLLFLSIPAVEWSSCIVMTDLAVALLCLTTTLAAGAYMERQTWPRAVLFGVVASLALLTKYLAGFVLLPPVALILMERRWSLLRNVRTWVAAAIFGGLFAPWFLWSRGFVSTNFDRNTTSVMIRLAQMLAVMHTGPGTLLTVIAIASTLWGLFRWKDLDTTQRLLWLQFPCLLLFLVVATQEIEARYLVPAWPGVVILFGLAINWAGRARPLVRRGLLALVLCLAGLQLAQTRIQLPGDLARTVARDLLADPKTSAILVPTSGEGPLIAELSTREGVRSRIVMVRPSKLLARMNWLGTQYQLLVPDVEALTSLFNRLPIDVIVIADNDGAPEPPHDRLLREMLASDHRWLMARRYAGPGAAWEIYRRSGHSEVRMDSLLTLMRSRLPSLN